VQQVIPRTRFNIGWGGGVGYMNLAGGGNSVTDRVPAPSIIQHTIPIPIPGTFRNLTITCDIPHPSVTVVLNVNGVDTALSVTLGGAASVASNVSTEVSVAAGDLAQLKYSTANIGAVGIDMGFAIEWEGAQQIYGVNREVESLGNDSRMRAGAFGNGIWASSANQTHSICAVPGTITGLRLHSYVGAPASGDLTLYVRKDEIQQDGTGGTTDTGAGLSWGGPTFATRAFSLHVDLGDRIEFEVERHGATASLSFSASLTFTPDDPRNPFMLCGGSNVVVSEWMWVQNRQNGTYAQSVSTFGPVTVRVIGLYVTITSPGGDDTYTYRLLDDAEPTAVEATIAAGDGSGLIDGLDVSVLPDSRVTLQTDDEHGDEQGNLHWGLAAFIGTDEPPEPETVCVTAPVSAACWNGGTAGAMGCATPHAGPPSGSCWNPHSIDAQRVALSGHQEDLE
jgi:hypothetical protein